MKKPLYFDVESLCFELINGEPNLFACDQEELNRRWSRVVNRLARKKRSAEHD